MKRFLTAISLMFILTQAGRAAEARLFFKASVRIPPGDSYISFIINPPRKITPFQLTFAYSPNCVSGNITPAVRYEGTLEWNKTPKNGYLYTTEDRSVTDLQFSLRSQQTFEQECNIAIYTFDELPPETQPTPEPAPEPTPDPVEPDPVPGVWREAGILNYPGGDFTLAGIILNATFLARELSLDIPENCSVTFKELGVIRSGEYVKANPSAENATIFQLDQASSFNQVKVTVTGPKDQICPIKLYVFDEAPR